MYRGNHMMRLHTGILKIMFIYFYPYGLNEKRKKQTINSGCDGMTEDLINSGKISIGTRYGFKWEGWIFSRYLPGITSSDR